MSEEGQRRYPFLVWRHGTWQHFFADKHLRGALKTNVQLVLTDPPFGILDGEHDSAPTMDDMKSLATLWKECLTPDGTVVVWCTWDQSVDWKRCFSQVGLFPEHSILTGLYPSGSKLQKRHKTSNYMRNHCMYAVVAHKAKSGFYVDWGVRQAEGTAGDEEDSSAKCNWLKTHTWWSSHPANSNIFDYRPPSGKFSQLLL